MIPAVAIVARDAVQARVAIKTADRILRDGPALGVWIREAVDQGLPGIDSPDESVHVTESLAVPGLWAVCWLDGTALRMASTRDAAAAQAAAFFSAHGAERMHESALPPGRATMRRSP